MQTGSFRLALLPALLSLSGAICIAQAPLNSVAQVNALTNAQADKGLPVELDATVTFVEAQDGVLFIQSDDHGVYINFSQDVGLQPGDLVHVSGKTDASFRAEITAKQVRILSHGTVPKPQPANFTDLIQSRFDSRRVTVRGRVLAAALDQETPKPGMRLQIQLADGIVDSRVARNAGMSPDDLLDSEVEATGVAGGAFDSRMQMAGVWLDIYSAADVVIKSRPSVGPWSLPVIPMDQVIYSYRDGNDSSRVKITGTLTYYEPGGQAVVEREGFAMLVGTSTTLPIHAGQEVEATGYPDIVNENVRLAHGQLQPLRQTGIVQPRTVSWADAAAGKFAYNLVAMEGEVVAEIDDPRMDLFIIRTADKQLFSATLRHESSESRSGGDKVPEVGSKIKVTGVCFMDVGNHWRDRLWFDLRMRSLADLAVEKEPNWWTTKRLAYMTTALSAAILLAVIWVGLLDRRLRWQTAALTRQSQEDAIRERRLARQEQQRSHILELISSAEPLAGVLKEIESIVSTRLLGANCWFELSPAAGGSKKPVRPDDKAIACQELFSRDGISLGLLLAMPPPVNSVKQDVATTLMAGARLAELAIETRRLYSDLRHRSEHDLLTEIPNRFRMEKQLDFLMQKAERNEGIFGLVYVDLDRFKQVNDQYGHRTGDLYLQEVTRRMKLQLRANDMLARIGGDEFIALVPILRSRGDAEEIVSRLEHCFDEPFELEEYTLLGSASVGLAVYPEDGTTKEGLQRAADAAMYKHKETRKRQDQLTDLLQRVWSEDVHS